MMTYAHAGILVELEAVVGQHLALQRRALSALSACPPSRDCNCTTLLDSDCGTMGDVVSHMLLLTRNVSHLCEIM